MDERRCIEWIDQMVAEHASRWSLGPGDVRWRLRGVMEGLRTLRSGHGALFGVVLEEEALERLSPRLLPRFEEAVDSWHTWLARELGDEGELTFRAIGESCGYFEATGAVLARDPEVEAAFGELIATLDDVPRASARARASGRADTDESIAYHRAPPCANARLIATVREDLPPQVAGLYALVDGFAIFLTAESGGRQRDTCGHELLVEPLARMRQVDESGFRGATLHVWSTGHVLCFDAEGRIWSWDPFDAAPRQLADGVAGYLRSLAARYR